VGKGNDGATRDFHDLFSGIPDSNHGLAWVLQVDCDSTATSKSLAVNFLNIVDTLVANDNFVKTIKEPFEALSRNLLDIEYCVMLLDKVSS